MLLYDRVRCTLDKKLQVTRLSNTCDIALAGSKSLFLSRVYTCGWHGY